MDLPAWEAFTAVAADSMVVEAAMADTDNRTGPTPHRANTGRVGDPGDRGDRVIGKLEKSKAERQMKWRISMRTNTTNRTSCLLISWRRIVATAMALVIGSFSQVALAQQPRARAFASPGEAVEALYQAAKDNDDQTVRTILGVGPELTSSGDPAVDKMERARFIEKYQEMHRLVREPDGSAVLHIGAENWPFPFPLVAQDGKWRFDADAGAQEIVARRIGEHESIAIQVCQHLAQASQPGGNQGTSDDPALEFARKLAAKSADATQPFQGYKFRAGSEQSVGVVLVAYPSEYGVSGVMTFIVLPGGAVYEKDLGPETSTLAPQINGKPDANWASVQ